MKKITRLLRPKSKKSKDAQYNALNGSSIGNGNSGDAAAAEPIPAVHNYSGKKTTNKKVKEKIITQTIKGKSHGGARKKTQSASSKSANASTSSERASIASTADNNNFNYSSLNRQRNSYSNSSCGSIITRDATPATAAIHTSAAARQQLQKRRAYGRKRWWRRLLHCGVCSCTRRKRAYQPHNRYKDYWNESAKTQKRCRCCSCSCKNSGRRRACGGKRWRWWCCCVKHKSSYQYDSEEDDDIDGKFAAYIYEMQQRDLNAQPMASADAAPTIVITHLEQSMLAKSQTETKKYTKLTFANKTSLKLGSAPVVGAGSALVVGAGSAPVVGAGSASSSSPSPAPPPPPPPAFVYRRRSGNGGLLKLKPRAWTWDDSLRSNSDRFLETLEEDELNTPSVCSYVARRPPLLAPTAESHKRVGEEAKAAAEESTQSPVIGKRNESTASPIQSRGSGTSETWPAQSDEDIDRLVAMHQNRDSLSSLGLRSDSMASVYSGAGEGRYGTVVVKGQVEFGIQYNYKLGALEIHVVRCKDLAAVDAKRNRSDPYVKVYLLPDKSKAGKRKTKVKKHTLNPIFDEILRFHMPISSLESRTLWLTVWHSDMFGRNDFLGEVSVNLQGKVFDNPQSQWYLLQERSEPFDEIATYRGDIVVGLKYIPPENVRPGFMRSASTSSGSSNLRKFGSIKSVASRTDRSSKGGQLHVLVKEAKHLSPIKVNGTCDAFCKSYLLPDRTRSSKQKTPVVKRSLHPTWNYTFIYEDVSLDDLSERALELTVWDHDRLASNEFLGGVRFSMGTGKSYGRPVEWMDATGKELSLWQNMIDRPNFWVEGSLILRSTLDGIRAIP